MVNFHQPFVLERDAETLIKFWHTVDGIYLWEFVTTLDYEWNVFRGPRPYPWTIWIYSSTRISTLVAVVLDIMGFDVTTAFNCQVWATFQLTFAYMAFAATSLLIVLRNIAVWNKNKLVVVIAATIWVANISFLIQGILRLRSTQVPGQHSCMITNTESTKPPIISTLVTDTTLLLIQLVGLLRLRSHGSGISRLGHLLWKQGVIWLAFVVMSGVPPVVFICLNINDEFNLMFQFPALIMATIATTRMYRALFEFASGIGISEDSILDNFRVDSGAVSKGERVPATHVVLSRMEVVVHKNYVQYPTVETSRDGLHSDDGGTG